MCRAQLVRLATAQLDGTVLRLLMACECNYSAGQCRSAGAKLTAEPTVHQADHLCRIFCISISLPHQERSGGIDLTIRCQLEVNLNDTLHVEWSSAALCAHDQRCECNGPVNATERMHTAPLQLLMVMILADLRHDR